MTTQWVRFRWDLGAVLQGTRPTQPPFVFRSATAEDAEAVSRVISSGFSLDSAWGDVSKGFIEQVRKLADDAFEQPEPPCVVVQHGTRVIGVSVVTTDPTAGNHLVTGPCILHEYRSRGLGSLLLYFSLEFLKDRGLQTAYGVTRARTVAARFVYAKYGSASEPCDFGSDPESYASIAA